MGQKKLTPEEKLDLLEQMETFRRGQAALERFDLVGNVSRDAERRTSQSGEVTYTAFGVGVGDGKDKTTFFSVLVFGKYGETVAQYVTKGRPVLVDGRVQVSDKCVAEIVGRHAPPCVIAP